MTEGRDFWFRSQEPKSVSKLKRIFFFHFLKRVYPRILPPPGDEKILFINTNILVTRHEAPLTSLSATLDFI